MRTKFSTTEILDKYTEMNMLQETQNGLYTVAPILSDAIDELNECSRALEYLRLPDDCSDELFWRLDHGRKQSSAHFKVLRDAIEHHLTNLPYELVPDFARELDPRTEALRNDDRPDELLDILERSHRRIANASRPVEEPFKPPFSR